jgi:hypothetical protein
MRFCDIGRIYFAFMLGYDRLLVGGETEVVFVSDSKRPLIGDETEAVEGADTLTIHFAVSIDHIEALNCKGFCLPT